MTPGDCSDSRDGSDDNDSGSMSVGEDIDDRRDRSDSMSYFFFA